MPFILAVTIRLYIAEARRPPPRAMPRKASFGGIVGETHPSVFQERREARPSLQDLPEADPAGDGRLIFVEQVELLIPPVVNSLLEG